MGDAARVCAVIVTFHPDPAQLLRQLASLRAQVDCAVLVDNSGDEGIRARLAEIGCEYAIEVIAWAGNRGIAAGHNAGIEHARRRQATHVLLMDQDSIPAQDMVARLLDGERRLAAQGLAVAAVGPRVAEDAATATGAMAAAPLPPEPAAPPWRAVDMLISSGTLISLAAIEQAGLMDESLFIDQVDTEWCLRARARGAGCYAIDAACMAHRLGAARRRLWLLRWYNVPVHSAVRHYFNFRNSVLLYRRPYVPLRWVWCDLPRLLKLFVYFGCLCANRRSHFAMMLRGVVDGWRGVTGNPHAAGLLPDGQGAAQ